jgi:hypothetical protein
LTADNLAEVLIIQQALREANHPAIFVGAFRTRERRVGAGDNTSIF